ncbi:glycoside hydrolase family 15 protein [Pseudoflavitalea sp. X16]|uniref:glycoside hydrolase family 15 protein n=1 Tax=Paraflavitalea devenefica TaxID=2716334 RepID=UPI001422F226|nr:glycoside hydrolase family 15 protein [Paraflavitalea devenefica]NII27937.1 glycoside hydrolase family 15 protein [Paraflavitalea devenefica]
MPVHKYNMGIIGNCSYLAYIDTKADVKWMCLPRFDSSFLFGSLLDEGRGGHFSIQPAMEGYTSRQYYVPNTNVLCTEFTAADGSFVVKDCAPRMTIHERQFRPLMMVRKIELISGDPAIRVTCDPRGDYGQVVPETTTGSNHIRYMNLGQPVRLTTDISLTYIQDKRPFLLDQDRYVVLTYGSPLEAPLKETCEEFLRKTIQHWQQWIKSCYLPDIYQEEIIRSALVLKLHQYEDTGGVIASGTTSLPEFHDSTRNWDYRFCWFRDAHYTLRAFNQIGHFEELEKYFDFIHNILANAGSSLQPLYSIAGEKDLEELTIDLHGYMGNKPVRVGNKAYVQVQHDVYGQVLVSLLPLYTDKRLTFMRKNSYRTIVPWLLNQIERTLTMPDSGLWEFRNQVQVHTYTLLFHWAGAKAAYKIGAVFNDMPLMQQAQDLAAAANKLLEEAYDKERKVYPQAIGTPNLDASTLTMVTMNYLDHNSQRARDHIAALEKELLADHGLFYRYKHYDDFGFPETTFLVCAFWYVDALACVGRTDDAIRILDKLLGFSNHLGIFSEDVHIDGSQWGNFPQTYSHVGLINAAFRIARKVDKVDFL